jgi:hypothetical protein
MGILFQEGDGPVTFVGRAVQKPVFAGVPLNEAKPADVATNWREFDSLAFTPPRVIFIPGEDAAGWRAENLLLERIEEGRRLQKPEPSGSQDEPLAARLVAIEDQGGYFEGNNVESALQELAQRPAEAGGGFAVPCRQGPPGPNRVGTATECGITGILMGAGGTVAAAVPNADYADTAHQAAEDALDGLVTCDGAGNYSATDPAGFAAAAHNHDAGDIATGTLAHEQGGLEADVSSYDGLVKISGGMSSAITDNSADWNAAYGWGNHADAGYLDGETALNSLADVDAGSPGDGDGLVYDGESGKWVAAPGGGGDYTDGQARDAVGAMIADTDTVDLTYTGETPELKADVRTQMSVTKDASGLKLSGDAASPGNNKVYGTDGGGIKGWKDDPAGGGSSKWTDSGTGYISPATATNSVNVATGEAYMVNAKAALQYDTSQRIIALGEGSGNMGSVTGDYQMLAGYQAGASLTSGQSNVAVGDQALASATTASYNVALGRQAMYSAVTAGYNVAVGYQALQNITSPTGTSSYNVAVGYNALQNNTFRYNVAVGGNALSSLANDQCNAAVGYGSLANLLNTGSYNIGIGYYSGYLLGYGNYNTCVGGAAGYGLNGEHATVHGAYGTYLGALSGVFGMPDVYSMTAAVSEGGSVNTGTHLYRVAYTLDGAATAMSAYSKTATTTDGNNTVTLSSIPTYSGSQNCTARVIYRTKVDDPSRFFLVTTISNNTATTYTDTTADASLGPSNTNGRYGIALGYNAATIANNTMSVGAPGLAALTASYWGGGFEHSAACDFSFNGTAVYGTDKNGSSLSFNGGRGAGSGSGGSLFFKTTLPGASGTAYRSLVELLRLTASGAVINETGADLDTRIEGDTISNLVNVDAGLDMVGVACTPASRLDVGGSFGRKTTALSGNTSLNATHSTIEATGGAGGITLTLPASTCAGRIYTVVKVDAGAGAVTVAGNGAETINGGATHILSSQWDRVTVQCMAGGNWMVIG